MIALQASADRDGPMALEPIRLLDASNSREMLDASNSRELHGGVDWIASDFGDGDQLVQATRR